MRYNNAANAFNNAISAGRLSDCSTDDNYAGHYMYMGTHNNCDLFKHIVTRGYLEDGGKHNE